ncbi:unnamed protein product, partial [marine sediment metagenome]
TLWNVVTGQEFEQIPRKGRFVCTVPRVPLLADRYVVELWCAVRGETSDKIKVGFIDMVDGDFYGTGKTMNRRKHGVFQVDHSWVGLGAEEIG